MNIVTNHTKTIACYYSHQIVLPKATFGFVVFRLPSLITLSVRYNCTFSRRRFTSLLHRCSAWYGASTHVVSTCSLLWLPTATGGGCSAVPIVCWVPTVATAIRPSPGCIQLSLHWSAFPHLSVRASPQARSARASLFLRNVKNKYCHPRLKHLKLKIYALLNRKKYVESKFLNKYSSYTKEIFDSFT